MVNTTLSIPMQIMVNLLSNALKFKESGEIISGYYNSKQKSNKKLGFFVTDTGKVSSASDQLIIFDRFRQAEETSNAYAGSTGLGLAISKALVTLLGGKIRVK